MSPRAAVRVVVGHEPRFYRESLAAALQLLLPNTVVTLVEPAKLDQAVAPGSATVVMCSALSETVKRQALAWILFYPDGENLAVVGIAGGQRTIPNVELSDLLAVIAEAQRLAPHRAAEDEHQPDARDPEPR